MVIELKRTEDGGHVELKPIRYAATSQSEKQSSATTRLHAKSELFEDRSSAIRCVSNAGSQQNRAYGSSEQIKVRSLVDFPMLILEA